MQNEHEYKVGEEGSRDRKPMRGGVVQSHRVRQGKATTDGGGVPVSVRSFYREVVQAVLFFGTDTWVLSVEMTNTVEGGPHGFPWSGDGKDGQITVRRDLEKIISGECHQRSGDSETGDVY